MSPTESNRFGWLTSNEAMGLRGGHWEQLKWKLTRWAAPFWPKPAKDLPQISVKAIEFVLTSPLDKSLVGQPVGTNGDGAKAWILSRDQCDQIKPFLEKAGGSNKFLFPGVTTANGTSAQIQQVNLAGAQVKTIPSGTVLDFNASVYHDSIKLLIVAEEFATSGSRTNLTQSAPHFEAACRAVIADGGAVILEIPMNATSTGTNRLILVSPRLIDSAGNVIRP